MTKRMRSDSHISEVKARQSRDIEPPAHVNLRERDWPFWYSIVRARAREHWTETDLENAANLARCKSDIEKLQKEIDAEGDVIENAKGTQIVNPKHTLLETLSRRSVALSRMVHVHAEATSGKSSNESKKNGAGKSLPAQLTGDNDDLLAKPTH